MQEDTHYLSPASLEIGQIRREAIFNFFYGARGQVWLLDIKMIGVSSIAICFYAVRGMTWAVKKNAEILGTLFRNRELIPLLDATAFVTLQVPGECSRVSENVPRVAKCEYLCIT